MIKTGRHGAVLLGAQKIASLSSWKLSIKQSLIDVSHFGNDGWDEVVAGNCSWEGSLEGSWEVCDDAQGQGAIQAALTSGADLTVNFFTEESKTSEKYSGKIKIESIDIDTAPKEIVKISVKFKGNGALAFPEKQIIG